MKNGKNVIKEFAQLLLQSKQEEDKESTSDQIMEINLKLNLIEVNVVLDAIGQLPTSTNAWPVAAKIRAHVDFLCVPQCVKSNSLFGSNASLVLSCLMLATQCVRHAQGQ